MALRSVPELCPVVAQVLSGEVPIRDRACREAVFQEFSRRAAGHGGPCAGPRQSLPSGLIAAGGHDVTWHSLRCRRSRQSCPAASALCEWHAQGHVPTNNKWTAEIRCRSTVLSVGLHNIRASPHARGWHKLSFR